jgi:DNA-binding response OmpR family regulator
MIAQAGYRSVSARSPGEAVTAAKRCGIDAVVADVQLEGGNAFDLLGDLRHLGFDAPVFMASAYATEGVRERARAAGVRDFFDKPFNFSTIKNRVDAALRATKSLEATVLILESHPEVRVGLERAVADVGFQVLSVGDGSKALHLLRSKGEAIDLVLMDLHATGPSGAELVRKACEIVPALHVIAISGDASRDEIRAAYEAGAASFLRKPISEERLGTFLKASLKAAREQRRTEVGRRERAMRLAAEPFLRSILRRIKSVLHAPSASRTGAVRGALALATVALMIGAGMGMALQHASNTIDGVEAIAERALQRMPYPHAFAGPRREPSLGSPQADEQIRLMRESNDFTRRYYQDYLRELRWQGQAQPAPASRPQAPAPVGASPSMTRDGMAQFLIPAQGRSNLH